ncbi:MAG: hypothetical protein ACREEE_05405 [Dongiaceae bacterium]
MAAEALETYVQNNAWQIELISERVKEAEAGGPFVEHDKVDKWLESLAGGRRQPRPRPSRSRAGKGV